MAQAKKPWWRRLHDATCPGSIFHIRPLQQICPVCRADLKKGQAGSSS